MWCSIKQSSCYRTSVRLQLLLQAISTICLTPALTPHGRKSCENWQCDMTAVPACVSAHIVGFMPGSWKHSQQLNRLKYVSNMSNMANLTCSAGELEALQGAMGTGDQTEVLGRLVSRVATLEAAAGEAEAQRRALHNQLVELRGNVCCCASARSSVAFLLPSVNTAVELQLVTL